MKSGWNILNGQEVLRNAIKTYGENAQLWMVVEEISELLKEISKSLRGNANHDSIVEELADTHIMLEQLRMIINISPSEINNKITEKLERLDKRLRMFNSNT